MGKKVLISLAIILALSLNLPATILANDPGPWVFGQEDAHIGANDQGRDGFFYMYTPEINTGGTYNPARFGYLVWASTSFWRFFGGASWSLPYVGPQLNQRFYNPNHVNEHGQPDPIDGHWFGLFGDGRFFPDAYFNPVLRWDAPNDGVFSVSTQVYAGVNHQYFTYYTAQDAIDEPTIDGVTVTIQQGTNRLFSANSGVVNINNNRVSVPILEVEMQAGESLFFITDQNSDPNWDAARWLINISFVGDLPEDEPIEDNVNDDEDYYAEGDPDEDEPEEDDEDIDEPYDEQDEDNDEDQLDDDEDYENEVDEDTDTSEYEYDEEGEDDDEDEDEYIEAAPDQEVTVEDNDAYEIPEEQINDETSVMVLVLVLMGVAVLGVGAGIIIYLFKGGKTKDKPI